MRAAVAIAGLLALALCVRPALAVPETDPDLKEQTAQLAHDDAALNAAYRKLAAALDPPRRERLVAAQRAWVRYRDAECEFAGSRLIGGPIGIEARAQRENRLRCLLDETRARTRSLTEELTFERGRAVR